MPVVSPTRTIFHLDMDAFFVSVEELFDPSLVGKPVVVGGRHDQRGVVAAASYEARKFGVHSAMPLRTAYKHCPHAIFVDGHPERYHQYSGKVATVLQRFSPKVEMASIDEAYLDMTGTERLHGPPLRAAHALHQAIKSDTGLNCSIGIASSRVVAKISSDLAKRNGILWVLPGTEANLLAPLEIRKVPGIGKVTEKALHELGVRTVGDLAHLEESTLGQHFGQFGLALAGKARGVDAGGWYDEDIGAGGDPKSISHEHTFDVDTADKYLLHSTLARLTEMVARRLREHKLLARTIQLKLRYQDFSTITRAHSLDHPTQVDREILDCVCALFDKNWKTGAPIRLLGVQVSSLGQGEVQLGLLTPEADGRWTRVLSAADRLRDRFGESAVGLASGLKGGFRERAHESSPRRGEGRSTQGKDISQDKENGFPRK